MTKFVVCQGHSPFPIISRLCFSHENEREREKRSSVENFVRWKKKTEIDDSLVIRTCGRFRIYLRRIFFFFFFSLLRCSLQRKRRERHWCNQIDSSAPFAMASTFFSSLPFVTHLHRKWIECVCVSSIVIEIHCILEEMT
jgi:hypothetical protein